MNKLKTKRPEIENRCVTKKASHVRSKSTINTNRFASDMIVIGTISIWFTLGMSCEKNEAYHFPESHDYTIMSEDTLDLNERNMDEKSGISFDLESDSLEDEIENIFFFAKEL